MHAFCVCNMKKILSIFLMLCIVSSLSAVPARKGWESRTLEDGSTVELQQRGDEFYHYWETWDGKVAVMQENGTFVLTGESAPTPSQVAARRVASPYHRRSIGTINLAPRGLVILVNYSDVSFRPENTRAAMDSMMNAQGYSYNGATGSSRDYFIAQSDSQYMPVFDVVGPVTLTQERAYYGGNKTNKEGTDKNAAQMIVDACQLINSEVDFSLYDNDNNGEIDFVYVIYAGLGEADGGPAASVWPHNWQVYTGASKTCYLDGKLLNSYACSAELSQDETTKSEIRSTIGTPSHEFGHVIGLPDYYDTKSGVNYDEWLTPNNWSIMDYGCYNNNGNTPPNYSIFDKYYIGWATPQHLAANAQLDVTLGTGYYEGYQLTGGANLLPYSTTNTVYYIENRQMQGWDAALPGHGMLVWQVKYSSSDWYYNRPNNQDNNPRYTLLSAVENAVIGGTASSNNPFPGSANVTQCTPLTGCAMTEITETNSVISFKYNGGAPSDHTDVEYKPYPANGVRKTLRDGQLIIVRGEEQYNAQGIKIQ